MSTEQKLEMLGSSSLFDLSCSCGLEPARQRGMQGKWVYPSALPDGSRVRMLKVLLDNACHNDCAYCAQRAGCDTPRARFEPEELARLFDQMVSANHAQALFLSSGLGTNAVRAMDQMLATVEIIRRRYAYRGFIHLKILPSAQWAQVERAAQLAQRLSINVEAPGAKRLRALSQKKNYRQDILQRMKWIAQLTAQPHTLARGHTTQFVVGAAQESDREIVLAAANLYHDYQLNRAYYSGLQPVAKTPLAEQMPVPFMREHRLYQVDFLLRKYGFDSAEIPFDADQNLSLEQDPKTVWAQRHPERFPLEVNTADPTELLRVPGIGPLSVKRLLAARAQAKLRAMEDLPCVGARARQAAPFLLFDGKSGSRQLSLF